MANTEGAAWRLGGDGPPEDLIDPLRTRMAYDLFVSYARRDNATGRVTSLTRQIASSFRSFAGRDLRLFFDVHDIQGMDDWAHRIQRGLRESHLFLAILSPEFLASPYCRLEWEEYVRYESIRQCLGEGVAPVYFVSLSNGTNAQEDTAIARMVGEMQRRQTFDLREWFDDGETALKREHVRRVLYELQTSMRTRLDRSEKARASPHNVLSHNPAFVGRIPELTKLRNAFARNQLGIVGVAGAEGQVVLQGLGGMGKTEVALAYAHAFAWDYPGGRWQVACEHLRDLRLALTRLSTPMSFEFSPAERDDLSMAFERVLRELKSRGRSLLILDNVSEPDLLQPEYLDRIPRNGQVDVAVTTRLSPTVVPGSANDHIFIAVDALPADDALALIRSHQPEGVFSDRDEEEEARQICRLLEGFVLAVETAAIFLGRHPTPGAFQRFRTRLESDLLSHSEASASDSSVGVRHRERLLEATLAPTLGALSEEERHVLHVASLFPADNVALPWTNQLISEQFPKLLARPLFLGQVDAWSRLLQSLFGQRLLQATTGTDAFGHLAIARMHRLVQAVVLRRTPTAEVTARKGALAALLTVKANRIRTEWVEPAKRWQIPALIAAAHKEFDTGDPGAAVELTLSVQDALWQLGDHEECVSLLARAFRASEKDPGLLVQLTVPLARVERSRGHAKEAMAWVRRALELLDQMGDTDDLAHAILESDLGRLELDAGNIDQAETHLLSVLERKKRLSVAPDETGRLERVTFGPAYFNLADVAWRRTDLEKARSLARTAYELNGISPDLLTGPQLVDQLTALQLLGLIELDAGNPKEARELLRDGVAKADALFHGPHALRASLRLELAQAERETGNGTGAERVLEEALSIADQLPNAIGIDVPRLLASLSVSADARKDWERSRQLHRRRIKVLEGIHGEEHRETLEAVEVLGLLEAGTGNLEEAQRLFARVIRGRLAGGPRGKSTAGDGLDVFWHKLDVDLALRDVAAVAATLAQAQEWVRLTRGPDDPRADPLVMKVMQFAIAEVSKGGIDVGEALVASVRSYFAAAQAPAHIVSGFDEVVAEALRQRSAGEGPAGVPPDRHQVPKVSARGAADADRPIAASKGSASIRAALEHRKVERIDADDLAHVLVAAGKAGQRLLDEKRVSEGIRLIQFALEVGERLRKSQPSAWAHENVAFLHTVLARHSSGDSETSPHWLQAAEIADGALADKAGDAGWLTGLIDVYTNAIGLLVDDDERPVSGDIARCLAALPRLRRALDAAQRAKVKPTILAGALMILARLQLACEEEASAAASIGRMIPLLKDVPSKNIPPMIQVIRGLGDTVRKRKKDAPAALILRSALDLEQLRSDPDGGRAAALWFDLSFAQQHDEPEKSAESMGRCFEISLGHLGPDHPSTKVALFEYLDRLGGVGRIAEADRALGDYVERSPASKALLAGLSVPAKAAAMIFAARHLSRSQEELSADGSFQRELIEAGVDALTAAGTDLNAHPEAFAELLANEGESLVRAALALQEHLMAKGASEDRASPEVSGLRRFIRRLFSFFHRRPRR